ncbi:DNA-processing protein DprA [Alphaproteobacteria bacterium]|nr:DNA-processing protein DprA [Alphaproteobacteria bacterium]
MNISSEQFSILRLMRSQNVGPQTFWALIKRFKSAQYVIENWHEICENSKRKMTLSLEKDVELEIQKTHKFGASFLFHTDASYPSSLKNVSNAPPVLSIKGNIDFLKENIIALVGARNGSTHGCKLSYLMSKDLGACGWKVISGLARGIDTSAHQGSLETGTISVLGNGLKTIYPEENTKLYEKISEKGLLLSEFSFDTEPYMGNFPRRNRLIASLARGIVVIEAAHQSGSLLTAQYGLEMGKDIFSVPGSPMDPRCRGSNKLIKQGAILTESSRDIFEVLDQEQWIAHRKEHIQKHKKTHPLF